MDRAARVLAAHIDIPPELAGSLGVLVISVVIVLIVWAVRGGSGGRQTRGTVARPGAPYCGCGMEAKWMLPQGHWHCDRCNQPVVPTAMPGPTPTAMPGSMPGATPGPMPAALPEAVPGSMPAAAFAPGPACPTCRGPGRWLAESRAWGCDRCRMLITQ